jgi:hypothetical protein
VGGGGGKLGGGKGGAVVDDRVITHVFLDGGKASVPAAARTELLEAYSMDVAAGRVVHAVERTIAGGSYRMFADIDLPSPGDLTSVVRRALEALPAALKESGDVVVCTRSVHGGKTGAHLVWDGGDDVRVDDRTASALRDAWVRALYEKDPPGGASDWESIVDASVYRRNGLRMPWSYKRGGDALAVYVPTHVASWGSTSDDEPTLSVAAVPAIDVGSAAEVLRWLLRTSLVAGGRDDSPHVSARLTAAAAAFATAAAPSAPIKKTAVAKVHKRDRDVGEGDGEGVGVGEGVGSAVVLSAEERAALTAALPAVYAACEVGARCRRVRGGGLVASSTSRFCHEVGREHGSNHVFFEFKQSSVKRRQVAVVQRCHKCADARVELPASADPVVAGLLLEEKTTKAKKTRRPTPSLVPSSSCSAAAYWMAKLNR